VLLGARAVENQEPINIEGPNENRSSGRESIWNVGPGIEAIYNTPGGSAARKPLSQAC
jgi:hypothetical protein